MLRAQTKPLNCEIFGIEADNKTQGMMLVIKLGRQCFSRHQEHPGAPLVYIDFLATAPWNRPSMGDAPAYKGVGRALVMAAVSLSFGGKAAGRVGLHSLPGAESFYRERPKMTDMGEDVAYQELRYFELSATQAKRPISS